MAKLDDVAKRGLNKIRPQKLIDETKQAYDKIAEQAYDKMAEAERIDAAQKEIAEPKPSGLLDRYEAGDLLEGEAAAMHKAVAICKGMLVLFNYPEVIPREAVYVAFEDICQRLDIRGLEELLRLDTTTQSTYYPGVQRLFHIVDKREATPEGPTPEQDEEDIVRCAHMYLKLVRCKKCRRYINYGYICIHCDNADG